MYVKVSNKVYDKLVTKLKKQQGVVIEAINKEAESYHVYIEVNLGDGIEARSDKLKVRIKEEGGGYKDISGLLDAVSFLLKHAENYSDNITLLTNGKGKRGGKEKE